MYFDLACFAHLIDFFRNIPMLILPREVKGKVNKKDFCQEKRMHRHAQVTCSGTTGCRRMIPGRSTVAVMCGFW